MYNYVVGSLFFIFFILMLYFLGLSIRKDDKKFCYNLITGYLIYSFFVALAGIFVQLCHLEWKIFFYLMILIIVSIILYEIIIIKKYNINVIDNKIKIFINEHVFLIVILAVLMFIFLCCFIPLWYCNHMDDGFYINKMAMTPYVSHFYNIVPGTGFYGESNIAYSISTYEIEAAFYIYFLKMTPTVYARFFLSGFNYFLLANCIYCFSEKVLDSLKVKYNKNILQFIPVIIIFFAFNEMFLKKYNLLWVQDSNQFTNAMYYGSSVVRTMGIIMLILPFFDKWEINIKIILEVIAISVVLISKSSIAVPIIFVTSISYLFVFFFKGKKNYKFIGLALLCFICGFGYYLNNNSTVLEIRDYSTRCFQNNTHTISFMVIVVLLFISLFYKFKLVYELNLFLIIIGIFIALPILANVTSLFGMYAFVMGRVNTVYIYTLLIVSYIYIYILFIKLNMKNVILFGLSILSCVTLSTGAIYSLKIAGGTLFFPENGELTGMSIYNAMKVMWHNKKIVPESTAMLGNVLNRLSNEKNNDIVVLTREADLVDGTTHNLAISITQFAPKVKSIAATFRYGAAPQGSGLENYNVNDQRVYEEFIFLLDEQKYQNFKNMLDKYPINCVVLPTSGYDKYMKKMNFDLYDYVADQKSNKSFYVYYRD